MGRFVHGTFSPNWRIGDRKKRLLYSMHKPFFGLSCKNNQILQISLSGFSVFLSIFQKVAYVRSFRILIKIIGHISLL